MTEGLALEIARYKMQEKGIGSAYILRFRHLILQPLEKRVFRDRNDLFLIIEPDQNLRVSSRTGILDFVNSGVSELQYVHSGIVTIENKDKKIILAKILQVIPNY